MKRFPLLLAGAIGLETLLGCGYSEFPQYSGKFELQDVSYTDPSFVGEKKMPLTLQVVDRMEYIGHYWNHRLQLEFIPNSPDQATGIFAGDLDNLTRIDRGVWPNDWYDGEGIHQEQKIEPSAWCNSQYLYFLYLQSIPPVEVLQNTYPGHGECFGKDPVTKMELCETLPDPGKVDFDHTEWYNAVEENGGITLHFTFTRYRRVMRDYDDKDCILPEDLRGKESLTFTYHSSLENLDDETDLRKGGIKESKENRPSVMFFRQVVPDIK